MVTPHSKRQPEKISYDSLAPDFTFFSFKFLQIQGVNTFIERQLEKYEGLMSATIEKAIVHRTKVADRNCVAMVCINIVLFTLFTPVAILTFVYEPRETRQAVVEVGPESFWLRTDVGFIFLFAALIGNTYAITHGVLAFDTFYIASCHFISSKCMILCDMLEQIGQQLRNATESHVTLSERVSTKIVI